MTTYTIARSRPRQWPREAAVQATCGLLVAGLAGGLTAFENSHRVTQALAVVIVVGGSLWFATTRRTALALALVMLYLGLLDGYLKLSSGSNYVTFVRDGLVFALAIGVLLRASLQRKPLTLPPMSGWVVVFVLIVFVQLANPDDGAIYHSLAGMRQHLEFVPLFFLTYAFVRTKSALRAFVVLLVVIGAVNGAVNIVQFRESPEQFASWGPGYAEKILGTQGFSLSGRTFFSGGEEFTRPFGLGSDAGDGGLMAAFAVGGVLALAWLPGRRRYIGLAAVGAALAIAGVVTAQGRAVVVCAIAVAGAYVMFTTSSRRAVVTLLVLGATTAVGLVAVGAVLGGSGTPALRSSQLTLGNVFQATQKSRGESIARIPQYWVKYPLGAGLGVSGPAAMVVGNGPQNAGLLDSENEFNFATTELGVPGMIAIVGFTVAVFLLALRRCRDEPDPEVRVLVAAAIAPIAGMIVVYGVSAMTPTTPAGPYLWAAGGLASYWLITRRKELACAAGPPQSVVVSPA
jgi:hypothetical protein